MLSQLQALAALLLGVAVLGLGNSLMFTLLGIRMSMDGVSSTMTGVVGSAYFVGMLGGSLFSERVISRVGHIRAFVVFASVSAIAALVMVLSHAIGLWAVLRVAMGFCSAGMFIVAESWLQFGATNETRGRTYALYALAGSTGAGLGPLAINFGDPGGNELFVVSALTFMACLLPVAWTTVSNPTIATGSRFGLRKLFVISPVAVVGAFSAGLVTSAVAALGSVFGQQIGMTAATISLLMLGMRLGAFLMQYPIGAVSDRFDRRHVMVALSLIACAVSFALLPSPALPITAVLVLALIFGGVNQPLYGLSVAHANDYVEKNDFVAASAGLLLAYGIGASIGPTAAAPLMALVGPGGLFLYVAVNLAAFAAFVLYRMRRRAPVPNEQQTGYVPVPAVEVAEGSMVLDPRIAEPSTAPEPPQTDPSGTGAEPGSPPR